MKRLNNKNAFTLVELLAVIVVLAIVMGLAAVGITSVLDNTRKSAFATNAKLFIEGARDLVGASEMSGMIGGTAGQGYAPSCAADADPKYIPVAAINLESGGEDSPYNNPYVKGSSKVATTTKPGADSNGDLISYVKVTPSFDATTSSCTYTYSIFLSDGVYAVGTGADGGEVLEANIATSSVQVLE